MGTQIRLPYRAHIRAAAVIGGVLALGASLISPAGAALGTQTGTPLTPVGPAPAPVASARPVGAVPAAASIHFNLALALPNAASLQSFASAVSTPGNALYGHYLAPGQVGQTFGASRAAIDALSAGLRQLGLRPGTPSATRLLLPVDGTAAQISSALHTGLARYRTADGRDALANTAAPSLPAGLASLVSGVIGLDTRVTPHPKVVKRPASARPGAAPAALPGLVTTSGPVPCTAASTAATTGGGYTADQLAKAYGFNTLYGLGHLGAGQTVAIMNLETFAPSDITTFKACYGVTTTVTNINVDGGTTTGTGGESTLDIETVVSLAPQAHVLVYTAPPTSSLDNFNQIVSDDTAQSVTTSWGTCEAESIASEVQTENTIFQMAAAQGQSILDASGDSGSEDCFSATDASTVLSVDDPGGQPFITGVGGTKLTVLGPPPTEQVWNEGPASGGGGGISKFWTMPTYQHGPDVINPNSSATPCAAPVGKVCREVPDISAVADPQTGYTVYQASGGGWTTVGGTSAAAPLVASLVALANEGCTRRVGFLNPALYNLATSGRPDFNDVTVGNNDANGVHGGLYPARVHYDMASGIGTPIGGTLAPDLCAQAPTQKPLDTGVAATPDGSTVFLAAWGANEVTVFDTVSAKVTTRIIVGSEPFGLAVTPDGSTLYATNYGDGTVSVIDAVNDVVTKTIAVGTHPGGVAVSPDGSTVYVANGGSGSISVIDTTSNTVTATHAVGGLPAGMAVTADGAHLLVANASLNALKEYNTTGFALEGTTTLAAGSHPAYVALLGSVAYVALPGTNQVAAVNITNPAATTLSSVTVGSAPYGVAAWAAGSRVVATNSGSSTATILNTATPPVVQSSAKVGPIPDGVAITHVTGKGTLAYVGTEQEGVPSIITLGP